MRPYYALTLTEQSQLTPVLSVLCVVAGIADFALNHTGQCVYLSCLREDDDRYAPPFSLRAAWISSHLTKLDGKIDHKHFIGIVVLVDPLMKSATKDSIRAKLNGHKDHTTLFPAYRNLQVTPTIEMAADRLITPAAVMPEPVILISGIRPVLASDLYKQLCRLLSTGNVKGIIISPMRSKSEAHHDLVDAHVYLVRNPFSSLPVDTLALYLDDLWVLHTSSAYFQTREEYLADAYLTASPALYKHLKTHETTVRPQSTTVFQVPASTLKTATKSAKRSTPTTVSKLSYATVTTPRSGIPATVVSTPVMQSAPRPSPPTSVATTPSVTSSVSAIGAPTAIPPVPDPMTFFLQQQQRMFETLFDQQRQFQLSLSSQISQQVAQQVQLIMHSPQSSGHAENTNEEGSDTDSELSQTRGHSQASHSKHDA